jgi:C1A family cysteine protease
MTFKDLDGVFGKSIESFRSQARKQHVKQMKQYTGLKPKKFNSKQSLWSNNNNNNNNSMKTKIASKDIPKNFDWRNVNSKNFVPKVRNQQSCGSCYTFASVVSFYHFIKNIIKNKNFKFLLN